MKHLACIMDGNRRWARRQLKSANFGHQKGAEAIELGIKFCLENSISYLSLYAFSLENFNRSKQEREYLFNLIKNELIKQKEKFIERGIRVRFIGERSLFPHNVLPAITDIEHATKDCSALNLNFLFCYGARQEIISGMKTIFKKIQNGELSVDDISETVMEDHLWTGNIPEPDLIIRTGGAWRLSNFLLYQAAYSELFFLDIFWPDMSEEHFKQAFDYFQNTKRNFGA